jgi:hypothetical protein
MFLQERGHPQGECPSHTTRNDSTVYGRGIPLAGALETHVRFASSAGLLISTTSIQPAS